MIRLVSAVIVPAFLLVGCGDPSKSNAAPEVAAVPTPASPAEASTSKTFEEVIASFDAATQHLVWVLPPGVAAKGPYGANVTVKADGKTEFDTVIPLTGEKPAAGSHTEYTTDAEVLRLSTDASYPQRLDEIRGVMSGITSKLGPGHGELIITSDFRTEIADAYREEYCVNRKIPPIAVYLEQGTPAKLQKLPIGDGEAILQATILASCASPT